MVILHPRDRSRTNELKTGIALAIGLPVGYGACGEWLGISSGLPHYIARLSHSCHRGWGKGGLTLDPIGVVQFI